MRPLPDSEEDSKEFFDLALSFEANLPEKILAVLRVERMTVLQKPNGVRGIVVGDVARRSRTPWQQPSLSSTLSGQIVRASLAVYAVSDMDVLSIEAGVFDFHWAMMCAFQRDA